MQKMLIIGSSHYHYELYNDGLRELNDYLSKGWKVVNMLESCAIDKEDYVLHLCYVVIEKEDE